ncbi:selenocysteine-specific elongation factor isoform X2 [Anabrus simplex]
MMILVIDITKGMQTQTAECLIIGELSCDKMIVVLNKIDLLPPKTREISVQKVMKKMRLTLSNTIFKDSPIVSVAARPGGAEEDNKPEGIQDLIRVLQETAFVPKRDISQPFLFAVDHCFSVRGQGTVLTGTVLQGCISINDTIEIPALKLSKKVKSLQMFREPVSQAGPGDRIGVCVTQFDPKQVERGLLCAPGYVSPIFAAVISLEKIKYFKGSIKSKARFHISMGHETIMASITVFGLMSCDCHDSKEASESDRLDLDGVYRFLNALHVKDEDSEKAESKEMPVKQYALLEFERSVMAVPSCLVIGSKLDIDIHSTTCRLAFHGRLLEGFGDKNYATSVLPKLKVYREKCKQGIVERSLDSDNVIVKNMFKKETNIQLFTGMKVALSTGEKGLIDSSFGLSGKVKIRIPNGLQESTLARLSVKKKEKTSQIENEVIKVTLHFKKFIYDPQKRMFQ